MDTERASDLPEPGALEAPEPTEWPPDESTEPPGPRTPPPDPGRGCGLHMLRIAVGAAVAFVVMSLLYGPNMAMMAIAFAVICTAGISLILIIPGCWLVGWVTIAAWEAISRRGAARSAP